MQSEKNCLLWFAALILASGFALETSAGTIGGTNEDWSRWQSVAGLPSGGLYRLAAGTLNGSLYAIGGDHSGPKTNVYRYDGTSWSEVAGLPAPRSELAAGELNGALYAIGGYDGVNAYTNVYRYDGTNWSEGAGLPAARDLLGVGVMNGSLYAVGGADTGGTPQTNVYCFDGTNWTEVAGLSVGLSGFAAGVLDNALYAAGGSASAIANTNVYRFDGTNWTEVAGLPAARVLLAGGVLNGSFYAVAGTDSDFAAQTNVYRYNGTNWSQVVGLPRALYWGAVAELNGTLYSIGGSGAETNVYRYPVLTVYSGVSPSSGSCTGGYQVVISGAGLSDGTDVTNVTLCGVNVSSIDSMDGATQVVVTAGVGTPGLGDVRVYSTSAGESVAYNAFTYTGPGMTMLGTNGATIASGESVSSAKGTDFGSLSWGASLTNTFAITNSGNDTLTISGVTTNGAGASAFSISDFGFSIEAGTVSNFNIQFSPPNAGTYTAAVAMANDSTTTPYIVYLAGTGSLHDQTITNFPNPGSQTATNTVHLFAQASSGLPMTNFTVISGSATISNFTNVTFSGAGSVSITASQAGNTNWNPAAAVTNTFTVSKAEQAALTFSPTSPQSYNTTNALSASGGSGTGVVCYAVESGPGEIVEATKLYVTSGAGTVTVVATKSADGMYNPISATGTVTCAKANQTITFPNPGDQLTTNTAHLSAQASSGLAVTNFTMISGPALISELTNVTFSGSGLVSIAASQAGDTNWGSASVTNTFAVGKVDQTITFPAIQNQNVTSVVDLTATASSGYLVRFAIISGPGTITNPLFLKTLPYYSRLSFTGTGIVLVAASQSGDEMWNAAPTVTNSVVVTNSTPAGEGSLAVVIRPAEAIAAGAQWRVDGGSWQVSGTIVTGFSAGAHTVNYSVVQGYTNPADQSVAISPNQLTAVQGVYKLISGDEAYNPISADFDGDHFADPAICQPATGFWAARFSGIWYQWGQMTRAFGPGGYAPVAADFDGDAKADPGLYNTTNGEWRAMFSTVNYTEYFVANLLGDAGSTAMAADFDGDRLADPAIYNPATGDWKARLSSGGYLTFTAENLLGRTGFAASAGDMDGDRLADPFVCDMATGQCMALLSSANYYRIETVEGFLGAPQWLLALADYDGDGKADPAIYDPETGTLAVRLSSVGYTLVALPGFLNP